MSQPLRGKQIFSYPTGVFATSRLIIEQLERGFSPYLLFFESGTRFETLGYPFELDHLKTIHGGLGEFIREQEKQNAKQRKQSKLDFVKEYHDLCRKYKLMIETDGEAFITPSRIGEFYEPSLKLEEP